MSGDASARTHHTTVVNGIRLHYAMAGAGEPVVLLHGWPQSSREWHRVMADLSDTYLLIAPDMRGMGYSGKNATAYDTDAVASDVHELITGMGIESVRIAGHDWGGAVAYSYAANYRDEVSALAVLEMAPPGFGIMEAAMTPQPGGNFLWHMAFQSVPAIPDLLLAGHEEEYLRFFYKEYAYAPDSVPEEHIEAYVRDMTAPGALHAGLGYYRDFFTSAEQNIAHARTPLTIPVTAWGGSHCLRDAPKACMDQAAVSVTGGIIDDCGHWVCDEAPHTVAKILREFFATV
ncbi:alpha/beta fold hydrolase [Tsukamurella spumae]|uniref:Alpha/beta hydrolase n=1 Tax=Tsukamurella spumae TaxID=44753 RepID=A0A846X638_9ACTN|nr:alpha/beta hydrolase [Tsukamurella spumae]NKY19779.1 alpha/beta hydrolase [Tsukamurella spumae]